MNKDEAIELLKNHIANNCDLCEGIILPIYDEVVSSKEKDNRIEQWTFRGLLKIAYNLKEKG